MELEQERQARSAHYQLLEYPLVADLLDPQSPIAADDLTATLLSSSADELRAALLCSTGRTLLQQTDTPSAGAVQRLRQLELALTAATPPGADL